MSEFLESLSATFGKTSAYADEQPVRAEIYSVERLEQYGRKLAAEHKTVTKKARAQLLPRLEDNGRKLADKLLELATRQPSALIPLIAERLGKLQKIPQSFVVQVTQRLREQDPAVTPVMQWLEEQLAPQGTSIEQTIHAEHQRQAAM